MTDPHAWVPPGGSQPAGPPPPATYQLNEVTVERDSAPVMLNGQPVSPWGPPTITPPAPPVYVPRPVPATRRIPRRRWITWVVVAVILVVPGTIAWTIGVVSTALAPPQQTARAPQQTPIPASESPVPTPTDSTTPVVRTCPPECLSPAHGLLLVPDGSLEGSLDGTYHDARGADTSATSALAEYRADVAGRPSSIPVPCFFLASRSPVSPDLGGPDSGSTDPVWFLGSSSGGQGIESISESARFFPDSTSASAWMSQLATQVRSCHEIDPSVDAAAPLATDAGLPNLVVADTQAGMTTETFDIQRDNVVVRYRFGIATSMTDASVRHYLHTWVATNFMQFPPQ